MPAVINTQHKYYSELIVCVLYFFFNTVFLPGGLTYMAVLSPLFLLYLIWKRKAKPLLVFGLISAILLYLHYSKGIHVLYYGVSSFMAFACFVFILAANHFVNSTVNLEKIFSRILYINTILIIVAIIAFFIPPLFETFWYVNSFTYGARNFGRLKMFTSEASVYALIFVPVFMYYFFKVFQKATKHKVFLLLLSTLPLVLSLSFGVLLGIFLAFLIVAVIESHKISEHQKLFRYLFVITIFLLLAFAIFVLLVPEHPVVIRIRNLFNNQDTSFKGRTTDSFILSYQIAELKSLFFGVGPGQIKVYGVEIYNKFYNLPLDTAQSIRIPNTVAETLGIYGIFGVLVRFGLLIYFYFKTKVYNNYYRQALFIFMFIYQFTGSYLYSMNEYVIWILAFSTTQFAYFDKRSISMYPSNAIAS